MLLRRTKDEALDLPPKVRTWQPVDIGDKQVAALEARALEYLSANPRAADRPGSPSSGC